MATNGNLNFTNVNKVTFEGVGAAPNAVIDTTTGKIGVGVDSPDANLHVVGNCHVSTNMELGGTLIMGTVTVEAQHALSAITATGNTTPHTIEFQNVETSLVTTGNVQVAKELTVTGNATVSSNLTVSGNVSINGNFSQITTGIGRVPIMGRISNTFLTTSPSILISDLPENVDIDRMKTAAYSAIIIMTGGHISAIHQRARGNLMQSSRIGESSTHIELGYAFYDGANTKLAALRYDIGSDQRSITVKQTGARYTPSEVYNYTTTSWTESSSIGASSYGVKDITIFY